MFYILMNLGAFLKNFAIFSLILGIILIIIGCALKKPKKPTHKYDSTTDNQKNDYVKYDATDNQPIMHVRQEIIYECPICGYTSDNRDEFDDGACIMCDAI